MASTLDRRAAKAATWWLIKTVSGFSLFFWMAFTYPAVVGIAAALALLVGIWWMLYEQEKDRNEARQRRHDV